MHPSDVIAQPPPTPGNDGRVSIISRARPRSRPRPRRVLAALAMTFALTAGLLGPAIPAAANQASWIKTSGSCQSQSGYVSFNRLTSNCKTNRAFGADAYLRSSGLDTYTDNWFVGTFSGATSNTSEVYSRWSVAVILCRTSNYVTHLAGLNTGERIFLGGWTGGLMSYRASLCA